MAEREGFEPPIALRLCLISSQVHSTGLCHLSACSFFGSRNAIREPDETGHSLPSTASSLPANAERMQCRLIPGIGRHWAASAAEALGRPCARVARRSESTPVFPGHDEPAQQGPRSGDRLHRNASARPRCNPPSRNSTRSAAERNRQSPA
jgi:hypothetical protein